MRPNVSTTALLLSFYFVGAARAAELRTVAVTGQSAPGTAAGVTYESFGSYLHPQYFYGYGGAVLNDAGQVAFRANLAGDGVDFTNHQGVWSEGAGSLALVARTGSQAPGAPAGVDFSTEPALELFFPTFNDAGQTAFYGATTDGGLGLWSEGSGNLAAVARSGEQAPGTPDGVTFNFANLYDLLDGPLLNNSGQTTFRAVLSGPGVTIENRQGRWSERSGSLELTARQGSFMPGPPGVVNEFMEEAGLNDAGESVFWAELSGIGGNSGSVWSEGSGSLAMVARQGSPVPGMPGVTFDAVFATGAINNAGQTVIVAGLSSDNSSLGFGGDSVWLADSGNLTLIARRGTHAPGTPSGVNFEDFGGWSSLNEAGHALLNVLLSGAGVDDSNDEALYLRDALGNLTVVGREGDQAPGTPTGTVFAHDRTHDPTLGYARVLNSVGQVAATIPLAGPGVDSTNDHGIWATDRSGAQQLIVRKGDELEVALGDFRTVSELSLVGDNGNSNGWSSAFNNFGQVAFWASFTDGSQGVFVSNKVATVPGDFNFDRTVDSADYVAWRKGLGTLYSPSHYDIWRTNFGSSLGPGSGEALPSAAPLSAAVPEPTALSLAALTLAPLACQRRDHSRRNTWTSASQK
jgi:hypothetical protein